LLSRVCTTTVDRGSFILLPKGTGQQALDLSRKQKLAELVKLQDLGASLGSLIYDYDGYCIKLCCFDKLLHHSDNWFHLQIQTVLKHHQSLGIHLQSSYH
jgi:hypothetical protein